jgi:hypothetical protein
LSWSSSPASTASYPSRSTGSIGNGSKAGSRSGTRSRWTSTSSAKRAPSSILPCGLIGESSRMAVPASRASACWL